MCEPHSAVLVARAWRELPTGVLVAEPGEEAPDWYEPQPWRDLPFELRMLWLQETGELRWWHYVLMWFKGVDLWTRN
jgi:hypothetical protein